MVSDAVKSQDCDWDDALQTGVESAISDLAKIVFGLSYDLDRLDNLCDGQDKKGNSLGENKDVCLSLLTFSILANRLLSLSYIEATPLDLVSFIHKIPLCG